MSKRNYRKVLAASGAVVPSGTQASNIADAVALTENGGAIGGTSNGDLPNLAATYSARTGAPGGAADGAYEDASTAVGQTANAGSADKADVDARLVSIANNFTEQQTVIAQLAADNVALRESVRENSTTINSLVAKVNSLIAALEAFNIAASS